VSDPGCDKNETAFDAKRTLEEKGDGRTFPDLMQLEAMIDFI